MNYRMISRIIALILAVEAFFLLPPLAISFADGSVAAGLGFVYTFFIALGLSGLFALLGRAARPGFYAREGLVSVGLGWIALSLVGCLPFLFSGEIRHPVDALFEIVSGFTTTGASILPQVGVGPQTRGILFWRSFSHWLGGMGVLVFLLAVVPISGRSDGFTVHLLRAESPGPNVGKLVPRMRRTAVILYLLYIVLTVLNVVFLLFGGMNWFEALCTAFGTAGTGGFGVRPDSIAGYSPYLQVVTAVFMLLFGVNFSIYYLLILGRLKDALKDEELRLYLGIVALATLTIAVNIRHAFAGTGEALRHAFFTVSSIMTTTGFATVDFDRWPALSKAILFSLMIVGASAGSTGGGLKVARLLQLLKSMARNIRQLLRPNRVERIRVNGQPVSEQILDSTNAYLATYVLLFVGSFLLVSLDGFSLETNISAVAACFNNIGPGFDIVGPTGNYASYSVFSKLILIFDMLAGRLEIFPMLVLFAPAAWKR
jgi:trk system potassium uptake protein TrkH